jgi:hypothetical protein
MSTLTYALLTNRREVAPANTSTSTQPPGLGTYVDAVAALVPAEVLSVHALIISATAKVAGPTAAAANVTTTIEAANIGTLRTAFWLLAALALLLYAAPRYFGQGFDRWDWVRIFIPPVAFIVWTMLQRATAFDAAFPHLADAPRTVYGLIIAVVLGAIATGLAYKLDTSAPPAPVPAPPPPTTP